jgi:hypothetical protein
VWGVEGLGWNDPAVVYKWNDTTLIDQQRRFPARSLRCSYKQIRITNSFTNITNSDTLGLADVDNVAKTVTLLGGAEWPVDAIDYFITFEDDEYTEEYLIGERTATVLTYYDDANTSVFGTSRKWLIRGYRKGEALNLLSYALKFEAMTSSQTFYKGAYGENA